MGTPSPTWTWWRGTTWRRTGGPGRGWSWRKAGRRRWISIMFIILLFKKEQCGSRRRRRTRTCCSGRWRRWGSSPGARCLEGLHLVRNLPGIKKIFLPGLVTGLLLLMCARDVSPSISWTSWSTRPRGRGGWGGRGRSTPRSCTKNLSGRQRSCLIPT